MLRSSPESRRERVARYLPGSFPIGIDLLVYTVEELLRLRHESPHWYQAIYSGRTVAGDPLPKPGGEICGAVPVCGLLPLLIQT